MRNVADKGREYKKTRFVSSNFFPKIAMLMTYLLTPWNRVPLEKLSGTQSRNSPHYVEPEGSLPHSQVPVICPYPEPDHSSPLSNIKCNLHRTDSLAAAFSEPAL
jgi:hypothetical protein